MSHWLNVEEQNLAPPPLEIRRGREVMTTFSNISQFQKSVHRQIQRVVWGLPDWWVKLLRTRLPKRGHLLVFRQNWTKPYLEVWVCLVLSALNLCFVSIIVSNSVWCGVRNQRRSNCSQFWDLGFYSDYVCLCLPLTDCLSTCLFVCVLCRVRARWIEQ